MHSTLPEIVVNFSHIEEDGLLFAGVAHASQTLAEGMRVRATDHEGHCCEAVVETIDGSLAYLALDWDTWTVVESLPPETVTAVTAGVASLDQFEVVTGEVVEDDATEAERSEQSTNLVASF